MSKINGIDVSEFQGHIDWEKVAGHVDFAIIRIGRCVNPQDDVEAARNIAECNRLGIPYGLYYYSFACTPAMAQVEANNCLLMIRRMGAKPTWPVYFDWEYSSRDWAEQNGWPITGSKLREIATAFCERIEEAGFAAGIYTNEDFKSRYYGEKIFDRYTLWYAYYQPTGGEDTDMWQHSSEGRIPGISGDVDLNVSRVNWPEVLKSTGRLPEPEKPAPAPAPDPEDVEGGEGRWRKLEDVPAMYRKDVKELMDVGALMGYHDQRGLYLSEDMVRLAIINKRYTDAKLAELRG